MCFCYVNCSFDSTAGGFAPPPRLREYKLALPRLSFLTPAFIKAWLPPSYFVDSVRFFSPSGAFLLSLWVGWVPLAAFSPFPVVSLAFSSSGWVGSPCRVFPAFSPCFLGVLGVVSGFLRFLLSLASCIFLF